MVLLAAGGAPARAEERQPTEVVVLKRAGVTAYEEVTEEFGERCRVRARVVATYNRRFVSFSTLRRSRRVKYV